MAGQRRAGLIQLQVDGEVYDCKGSFTYDLGIEKRESIVGSDRVHGYKATPKPGFIEGVITDRGNLDVAKIFRGDGLTITLTVGNGKTISLSEAFYAGDGTASTEEAEIAVRWEGDAEEII